MKLFVISLERALERRLHITKHLNEQNISYELFDAVDGQKLTPEDIAAHCDMDTINKYPKWLTKGMLGACLSHYFIYKKIVEDNIPIACILEDDAIVVAEFTSILDAIEKDMATDTLTMLHYASFTELKLSEINTTDIGGHRFYEPLEITRMNSAAGYVITKEICERLISILFPIHMGPDSWDEMRSAKAFSKVVCVYPRPVNTIHAKSTLEHLKTGSLLSRTAHLIDQHKIFPMYQILNTKEFALAKR